MRAEAEKKMHSCRFLELHKLSLLLFLHLKVKLCMFIFYNTQFLLRTVLTPTKTWQPSACISLFLIACLAVYKLFKSFSKDSSVQLGF